MNNGASCSRNIFYPPLSGPKVQSFAISTHSLGNNEPRNNKNSFADNLKIHGHSVNRIPYPVIFDARSNKEFAPPGAAKVSRQNVFSSKTTKPKYNGKICLRYTKRELLSLPTDMPENKSNNGVAAVDHNARVHSAACAAKGRTLSKNLGEALTLYSSCSVRSGSTNRLRRPAQPLENNSKTCYLKSALFDSLSSSLLTRNGQTISSTSVSGPKVVKVIPPITPGNRPIGHLHMETHNVTTAFTNSNPAELAYTQRHYYYNNIRQCSICHRCLIRPLTTHDCTTQNVFNEKKPIKAMWCSSASAYGSMKKLLEEFRADHVEKSLSRSKYSEECLTSTTQEVKTENHSNLRVSYTPPVVYCVSVLNASTEDAPILRYQKQEISMQPQFATMRTFSQSSCELRLFHSFSELSLPTTGNDSITTQETGSELNMVCSAGLIEEQAKQNCGDIGTASVLRLSSPPNLVELNRGTGGGNEETPGDFLKTSINSAELAEVAESRSEATGSIRIDAMLSENDEDKIDEEDIFSTSDASSSESLPEMSDGEVLLVNHTVEQVSPVINIEKPLAELLPLNDPPKRPGTSFSTSKPPPTPATSTRYRRQTALASLPADKTSVSLEHLSSLSVSVPAQSVIPSRPQGDTFDDGVITQQKVERSDVPLGEIPVKHPIARKSPDSHLSEEIPKSPKNETNGCPTTVTALTQMPGCPMEHEALGKQTTEQRQRSAVEKTNKRSTKTVHPALIASLFPKIPPVLRFVEEGHKLESLPWEFRRLLRWRASLLTPIVVKQALLRSGFRVSRLTSTSEDLETIESSDWIFYFGKHMRPQVFRSIREYQKVNHLPCSFQLGRKDRLWRNVAHMQNRCGRENFSFMPETFCLPGDLEALKKAWDEEGTDQRWILKPPASARGIGVRLITKWAQVPKKRQAIVQKYLGRPFLINDSKFDLRIYVYISSINPLRVYIHEEGLVRFASQKYNNSLRCIGNRFVHLTNYSINRLNSEYVSNSNDQLAKGHKWSLRALWAYFKTQGISPTPIWSSIKDVVVKTAISTEAAFNAAISSYCNHSCSVHEVFGFDIFLDENLQPWLLEVNVSPSMHSDSPLDAKVKGTVVKDMLNICGLRLPEASEVNSNTVVPTCLNKVQNPISCDVSSKSNCISSLHFDSPSPSNYMTISPCGSGGWLNEETLSMERKLKSYENEECPMSHSLQKPKGPSHEWVMDSRLHITHLSEDEKEKRRYYVMRATRFELPRAPSRCHSRMTSSGSIRERSGSAGTNNHQNEAQQYRSRKSKPSAFYIEEDILQDGSVSTVSSTSGNESTASSIHSVGDWPPANNKENLNNSANRTARSMGIGPSSPDLKSHRLQQSGNPANPKPPALVREKSAHRPVVGNALLRSFSNSSQGGTGVRSSSAHHGSEGQTPTRLQNALPRVRLSVATADILNTLTPSDVRILTTMVDELERAGGFQCVFPPSSAGLAVRYLSYFEAPRYANLLCVAYMQKYGQDKEKGIEMLRALCEKKVHLMSGAYGDRVYPEHVWRKPTANIPVSSTESIKSPTFSPVVGRPTFSNRPVN